MRHPVQDNKKIISGADVALILVLLLAGTGMLLYHNKHKKSGFTVQISVSGNVQAALSLDEDTVYDVETEYGHNQVVIEHGQVYVRNADCPDGICVSHRAISNIGETIICLPHQLVVEVK